MLKIVFIYFLIYISSTISYNILQPIQIDQNIKIISQVLNKIAEEFLVKEDIKFKILNIQTISSFSKEILNDFMSNSNEKFSVRLF